MSQQSITSGWRKSTRCDAGNCVEMAQQAGGVGVRNNARPDVHLSFDTGSWRDLLRDVRDGRLVR